MRQGQHNSNKRSRGRHRKGPNPANRSYESNGPDVKIRGTAAHIAEKYATLARDATASGDRVMAENYFQHCEHYSRIVAASQAQAQQNAAEAALANGRDESEPQGSEAASEDDQPSNSSAEAESGLEPTSSGRRRGRGRRASVQSEAANGSDQTRNPEEAQSETAPVVEESGEISAEGSEDASKTKRRRAPRRKVASLEPTEESASTVAESAVHAEEAPGAAAE